MMHALDEPSTFGLSDSVQFSLPRQPKPTKRRDIRNAERTIIAVLAGGNALLWGYIIVRAFL